MPRPRPSTSPGIVEPTGLERPMSAVEALRQLRVSFGDPSWIDVAQTPKRFERPQSHPPRLERVESRRRPPHKFQPTPVKITRPAPLKRPTTSPGLPSMEKKVTKPTTQVVHRRRSSASQIALAEHLEKIEKATTVLFQSSRETRLIESDHHLDASLIHWKDRAMRVQEKRRRMIEEKERKTRDILARPEKRKEKEAQLTRQRQFLVAVFTICAADFFKREHKANNDREWAAAALGSNALGGTPIVAEGDDDARAAAALIRFERTIKDDEDLLLPKNNRSALTTTSDKMPDFEADHRRRTSNVVPRRRSSSIYGAALGAPSAKTLAIQRKRVERIEKAVKIIRKWWFDRKVKRTLNLANDSVPTVLRSFVRFGECAHFKRKRERCVLRIVDFLLAVKRSGFNAIRRLVRAVKRCQATIRASSQCRAARLLVLERAFQREERLYRDFLIAERKRAEVAAVKRMCLDPIFGWRTARLFDANQRMRDLITKDPASKRMRARLRALKRRQHLHDLKNHPEEDRRPSSRKYSVKRHLNDDDDDDPDDSVLKPCPVPTRKLACDAILTNQRRLFRKHLDKNRRHTRSYDAKIDDVRDLFFNENSSPKTLCVQKRMFQPFLLLTPHGGGLDEIRDYIRRNHNDNDPPDDPSSLHLY